MEHRILHYVRVQRSRGVSKGYKSGVKGYLGPVLQRSSAEEPRAQAGGPVVMVMFGRSVTRLQRLQLEPRETDVPSRNCLFQFQH